MDNDLQMYMGGGKISSFRRRLMMRNEESGGEWLSSGIRQGEGAYIVTDYKPTTRTLLEIDIQFGTKSGKANGTIVSCAQDSNESLFNINFGGATAQFLYTLFFWNNLPYHGGATYFALWDFRNKRITIRMGYHTGKHIFKVGSDVDRSLPNKLYDCKNPLVLLRGDDGIAFDQSDLVVLHSVKFYENDILSAELLPYDRGGVIGLKDTISGKFNAPRGGKFSSYIID